MCDSIMEVSPDIAAGLKLLGNSSITDDCFTKLLEAGINVITDFKKNPNLSQLCNTKGDMVKQAYASMLSLLVESARHDISSDELSAALLQEYNFTTNRNTKFVKSYQQNKSKLQAALSHIGSHPPHIVDAKWTLDYCIKASSLEHVGTLQYLIQLHTEDGSTTPQIVRFVCSLEQLHDLVSKLRDALKQVERVANM